MTAGAGWCRRAVGCASSTCYGNQAVDTLFYDAHDHTNRYSAMDTIREQGSVYLTTGSRLVTQNLDVLATITEDTCGRHDTIGGACAQESNVVRYGGHVRHQHACRITFMDQVQRGLGMDGRDLTHNINFFMNVPVDSAGGLMFADGVSAPGKYVELRGRARHPRRGQQLSTAEQPLQRLQPDGRAAAGWRRDGPGRAVAEVCWLEV